MPIIAAKIAALCPMDVREEKGLAGKNFPVFCSDENYMVSD